jgi:hypothetical protein
VVFNQVLVVTRELSAEFSQLGDIPRFDDVLKSLVGNKEADNEARNDDDHGRNEEISAQRISLFPNKQSQPYN